MAGLYSWFQILDCSFAKIFTYIDNYQASIDMALYETLYGGSRRSPLSWAEVEEISKVGPDLMGKNQEGYINTWLVMYNLELTEKLWG